MSRARKQNRDRTPPAPEPVDVVDGIPDRSSGRGRKLLIILGVLFAAWVAFLVYCAVAAPPQ